VRLLKLLVTDYFEPSLFCIGDFIAKGAYGAVYKIENNESLVVKLINMPNKEIDRCALHDIFTEICAMEEVMVDKQMADLVEYGITNDYYWIVMKRAKMSIKEWRLAMSPVGYNPELNELLLEVYDIIIKAVKRLHNNNIVH